MLKIAKLLSSAAVMGGVTFGATGCRATNLSKEIVSLTDSNKIGERKNVNALKIEVLQVNLQPTLVIKDKVKIENAGETIARHLEQVAKHIEKSNSQPAGPPYTRTFNFEDGWLEFETGFPIVTNINGSGEIISSNLPQGRCATTVFVGSQKESAEAYQAVYKWIAENGFQDAGAPWEFYLSDPTTTPENESKIQILIPLK